MSRVVILCLDCSQLREKSISCGTSSFGRAIRPLVSYFVEDQIDRFDCGLRWNKVTSGAYQLEFFFMRGEWCAEKWYH